MQPESQYNTNRTFELRVVIFFLVLVLLLLGSYTQKKMDENKSLRSSMELLENSVEQQKQKNQHQLDSLRERIQLHDRMHLRLKDSLSLLKRQRLHLKSKTDENKAAIHRIRDIDSLFDTVARHYQ